MDNDLITVVIPTYNRKEKLINAIKSITDQRVNRVKIHIFDNNSQDGTEDTVKALMTNNRQIHYTKRKSNIGSLSNYIDALAQVETPYFIALADDDWLLDGSIEILLSTMLKDPTVGAVISQTLHRTEAGDFPTINPCEEWEFKRYTPDEFLPHWYNRGHFEWSSILFKTSASNCVGGQNIKAGLMHDVEFQMRFFSNFPVRLIRHKSAVYQLHSQQTSRGAEGRKDALKLLLAKSEALLKSKKTSSELKKATRRFQRRWLKHLESCIVDSMSYVTLKSDLKLIIANPLSAGMTFRLVRKCVSRLIKKWIHHTR